MTKPATPTIRDVALAAGVAQSTVSRALRGSGRVDKKTQERIAKIAESIGYVPSRSAQSLRSSRTMTIGVLIPDLRNPIFGPFVRGAEHAAGVHDYSIFICDGQGSPTVQVKHLRRLFEHRVDAVVIGRGFQQGEALTQIFGRAGVPFEPEFATDPHESDRRRLQLEVDATREAFHHLVGLGHRKFFFLAPTRPDRDETTLTRGRIEAIRTSVAEVTDRFELTVAGRQDDGSERQVIQDLATRPRPHTCFVAGSHSMALPVLSALFGAGLEIPSQASFVGFGDSNWAENYRPALATIRYDYYLEGRRAIDRLIGRLNGETPSPDSFEWVASEFLPRASCGPAPA